MRENSAGESENFRGSPLGGHQSVAQGLEAGAQAAVEDPVADAGDHPGDEGRDPSCARRRPSFRSSPRAGSGGARSSHRRAGRPWSPPHERCPCERRRARGGRSRCTGGSLRAAAIGISKRTVLRAVSLAPRRVASSRSSRPSSPGAPRAGSRWRSGDRRWSPTPSARAPISSTSFSRAPCAEPSFQERLRVTTGDDGGAHAGGLLLVTGALNLPRSDR